MLFSVSCVSCYWHKCLNLFFQNLGVFPKSARNALVLEPPPTSEKAKFVWRKSLKWLRLNYTVTGCKRCKSTL